jgi:hypothetical protein
MMEIVERIADNPIKAAFEEDVVGVLDVEEQMDKNTDAYLGRYCFCCYKMFFSLEDTAANETKIL